MCAMDIANDSSVSFATHPGVLQVVVVMEGDLCETLPYYTLYLIFSFLFAKKVASREDDLLLPTCLSVDTQLESTWKLIFLSRVTSALWTLRIVTDTEERE
jgi:hypothetical protein